MILKTLILDFIATIPARQTPAARVGNPPRQTGRPALRSPLHLLIPILMLCATGWASAGEPIAGEARQSLDGVWRFTTNVSNPPESWVDMTVPGNWDSTAQFSTYVGVGWYRRTFTPDPALQGKSVRLHFGAVYHEAEVFLNGVSIGTHVGGYTPFEFDVTDELIFGQPNEITVSADNTYKRGAWWPWGGISRSVTTGRQQPGPPRLAAHSRRPGSRGRHRRPFPSNTASRTPQPPRRM